MTVVTALSSWDCYEQLLSFKQLILVGILFLEITLREVSKEWNSIQSTPLRICSYLLIIPMFSNYSPCSKERNSLSSCCP